MVNIPNKAPYLHKEAKEMAAKMASHILVAAGRLCKSPLGHKSKT